MPPGRKVTLVFIAAVLLLVGGYDLYAYLHFGNAATISRTILDLSNEFPIIPCGLGFGTGVLVAHLFTPVATTVTRPTGLGMILCLCSFGMLVASILLWKEFKTYAAMPFLFWVTPGWLTGYMFVPQHKDLSDGRAVRTGK